MDKSQRQQDEIWVLSMILSYRRDKEEPLICPDQVLKESLPCDRALMACGRLIGLGELARHNGGYLVTLEGEQRYQDAMDNPIIPTSVQEWKTEAITGAREGKSENGFPVLQPTNILNPVIPGHELRPTPKTPEELYAKKESREECRLRIAEYLGVSPTQFDKYNKEGRIRLCVGLDERTPHHGIFHKNGKSWRKLCYACERKKRQNERCRNERI